MNSKEKEFLKRLLSAFKIEAEEHLKAITAGLLELEKESRIEQRASIIEVIFREAHSMKGAARSVNLTEIESICQSLEGVFYDWKEGKKAPAVEEFDALHRSLDTIGQLLLSPGKAPSQDTATGHQPRLQEEHELEKPPNGDAVEPAEKSPVLKKEEPAKKKAGVTAEEDKPSPEPAAAKRKTPVSPGNLSGKEKARIQETVRIQAAKLDSLLRQAEELSFVKLELGQYVVRLRDSLESLELGKKQWAKLAPRVKLLRQSVDRETTERQSGKNGIPAAGLLEFLDWNFEHLKLLGDSLKELEKSVEQDRRSVSGKVNSLISDLKTTLMSPSLSLLEIFPKIVRELSRDQGKQVELVIRGGEVKIDRRIMEEIKEPLIHLVRNAIDHGIEKPAERARLKKSPCGTLTLAINQLKSNQIEILISDDGAGIDLEKIKNAAVKSGVIREKDVKRLTYQETMGLIFESNISTSAIITDISGRGLGLTIAREKVEKVSGSITVETSRNAGTVFRIVLPITLASFRAVLVQANGQIFAVPTVKVIQTRKIHKEGIKTIENRETISLNGHTIPLVRLTDVLELQRNKEEENSDYVWVLVLGAAEKLVAISVGQILNEQEILLKNLGSLLPRVRNVTGAAVLGSGRVVPVLNVTDLIKSAGSEPVSPAKAPVSAVAEKEKRKTVLVVEDSITARMLLKNILESAGYDVKTAVDGVDGFTQVRTTDFDLVVSDVDMPRMNGFDLTAKIRSDKKLAELPVVLVTALDSSVDRERGIDVGANAYIIKSTFDQSNLLEVVERLI